MADGDRSLIACPMCGTSYDPAGRAKCGSCPLQSGCTLVCCPNCGHATVDPNSSVLARGAGRLLSLFIDGESRPLSEARADRDPWPQERQPGPPCPIEVNLPLSQLGPGLRAVVAGLSPEMMPNRRQAMQAYGVMPGKLIQVLQQSPLTVFRVDHIELALETELAELILVEPLQPFPLALEAAVTERAPDA